MIKVIPNFLEYSIDTNGNVYGKRFGKPLKVGLSSSGYNMVCLCKDGKENCKLVHRLVLETFVGKCPDGMECCHNNGNRLDNKLSNLRWDTRKHNHADAIRHGTHVCLTQKGENHSHAKLTRDDVEGIIELYDTGLYMQWEIGNIYGVGRDVISRIVNKKAWKHIWDE